MSISHRFLGTAEHPVNPRIDLRLAVPRRTKLVWQVRTENHAPAVVNIPLIQRPGCLGAAERWISFPEDRSIVSRYMKLWEFSFLIYYRSETSRMMIHVSIRRGITFIFSLQSFPAESFAPKIQMEKYVAPKLIPRNVAMERRRRQYRNLRMAVSLIKENISPRDILPPEVIFPFSSDEEKYGLYPSVNYLPLEVFDDEEFDCRFIVKFFFSYTEYFEIRKFLASSFLIRNLQDDRGVDQSRRYRRRPTSGTSRGIC